ncbi:MAG: endonuclease III, partial [Acholeplasmataceae bacterium]
MNRIDIISKTLNEMFPHARAELQFNNTFELLIAVVLSAQTTDISVNRVTPQLFSKYPTPRDLKNADTKDIESIIRSIGLYRNKAKNIIALSAIIDDTYQGIIPRDRDELEKLPGVGRKTANVVISNAFGIPAFAVDTHVKRISIRLGLAEKGDSVLEIEKKLMKQFPKSEWLRL